MAPKNYRYYCLDRFGHLHNAQLFHADNDEDAIAQVKAARPNDTCEIWQDNRLVTKLTPERLRA